MLCRNRLGEACGGTPGLGCSGGLDCQGGVCARPRVLGESCSASATCRGVLRCVNGLCAKPPGNGASCDPNSDAGNECDYYLGLGCGANGTCAPTPVARLGEACTGMQCDVGTYCNAGADVPTCQTSRREGETCNLSDQLCQGPLLCLNGTCQWPSAALCPAA
jgi:hypothetical protein